MTFGALTVLRPDGSAFTGDEVRFLAELGHRAALTLDNARLYESERFVALELQRSLLPARLPRIAELDVAGRYLAGAAGTEVGGDWYDVIPLRGGRVAVAVGDVMGRGVRAAAVMGQLRAALRSYAVEGLEPGDVLEHLAAFTEVLEGEHLVTCLVGVHDAASSTVTFASAGHPPPLRVGTDGAAGYVEVEPGLPLGVPASLDHRDPERRAYPECTVKSSPGTALLLFTDGLVEERDVPLALGLERLAAAFGHGTPDSAAGACETALRAMGRDSSHDDDTAVLALRVVDVGDAPSPDLAVPGLERPLDVVRADLPAGPRAPAAGRRLVTRALDEAGLGELDDTASLLVSEVVTNALRHGGGARELAGRDRRRGRRGRRPRQLAAAAAGGAGRRARRGAGGRRRAWPRAGAGSCSSICWRTAGAGGPSPRASWCGSGSAGPDGGATAGAGGRPPCRRGPGTPRSATPAGGDARSVRCGSVLLDALVRDAREQRTDLGLPVPSVPAQRADRRQLAGLGPPRDRLGVDAEESRDLGRSEQRLRRVGRSGGHGHPPRTGRIPRVGTSCPVEAPGGNRNGARSPVETKTT